MKRLAFLCALVAVVAVAAVVETRRPAADAQSFPDIINLPNGWLPEGVAIGRGDVIYAGSRRNGAVYAADLRTGEGRILVPPQTGRIAVGLAFDARSNSIFVAGGPGGAGYVYSADSGDSLAAYQFVTDGSASFVNDVDVTNDAAYFTDSQKPVLYKVPLGPGGELAAGRDFETIELKGDYHHMPGFNLNGIVATADGKDLIVVQSNAEKLFRVDPNPGPNLGVATEIDTGGATVANGDGLTLEGNTLYVVRNQANMIAQFSLAPDLASARLERTLTSPNFDVPTTAERFGNTLYAVNARFNAGMGEELEYTIVGLNLEE